MGSEKKRKRVSHEPDAAEVDKAERKRLKKLKKEKEAAIAAAADLNSAATDDDTQMTESTKTKKQKTSEPEPLLSPIASRTFAASMRTPTRSNLTYHNQFILSWV